MAEEEERLQQDGETQPYQPTVTVLEPDVSSRGSHRWTSGVKRGLTSNLVFATVSCAFGSSFQFGYNTGVINQPGIIIQEWIREVYRERHGGGGNATTNATANMEGEISDSTLNLIWAITVAIFCVGGVFGGVTTAFWVTRFGRKRTLLANNLIAIIAGALMGLSKIAGSYEMLILGRLLIGLNAGLNSGAGPMYLTEISPVNLRGALGSMHQLVVTISILVSQLLGLPSILGSKTGWPFLLALTIVAAIFQLVTLPFCPESPKYLLIDKQQEGRAQKALITLRNSSEVYEEMDEMKSENQKLLSEPKVAFKDLFVVRALRMPLLITVIMMLSQQLSGINAVMYYSTSIFTKAQLSTTGAMWATIGVGCINVIMTVISVVLVEKAGRRTLHLIGLGGMLLMTVLLTITLVLIKKEMLWATWICVIGVFLFVIFFATGPGSIPWFIAAELFGQGARPAAMTIGVVANWSANFIVGLCFPLLQSSIDQYVFLVFTGSLLFFWLFTYKFVPETKGRPIEEITAMFKSNALGGNSQQI